MKLLIINGPNLNLLGSRQPEIYGSKTFEDYYKILCKKYQNANIDFFQTNIEGEIIDSLQKADGKYDGIILNAAGFTHTSIAIGDCVAAIKTPLVEVHISNILAREVYRQNSFISAYAKGVITGFGLSGYELAVIFFTNKLI